MGCRSEEGFVGMESYSTRLVDQKFLLFFFSKKKNLVLYIAGKLASILIPKVKVEGSESWTWKFQRPVFGGGRVYALAREGGVVAYGNTRTGNEWPGWHN